MNKHCKCSTPTVFIRSTTWAWVCFWETLWNKALSFLVSLGERPRVELSDKSCKIINPRPAAKCVFHKALSVFRVFQVLPPLY